MEELPFPLLGRKRSGRRWKLVSILIALFVVGVWGWMGAKKEVKLVVDGKEQQIRTFARTVKDLLQAENIVLAKEDSVEPQLESWLPRNATIVVQRAFPVKVKADGKTRTIQTTLCTVAQVLQKAEIAIGTDQLVTPGLAQIVKRDTEIVVVRRESKIITVKEEVPFAVHRRSDPTLNKGKTKILEQGTVGVKEKTYSIIYHDGKQQDKELVSEKVVKEAIDKIILIGTRVPGGTVRTSRGAVRYRKKYIMEATAYTPRPRGGSGITATGRLAQRGLVAVDPRVIPLHARLYIPGYGFSIAADTGGAIRGNRIDLCYDLHAEAVRFGRRKVEVYLLQ